MSTADDEVWIAIKRGEGYEDVHPDLVAEDAMGDSTFEWRVLPAAPTAAAHGGAEFFFGARIAPTVAQPLHEPLSVDQCRTMWDEATDGWLNGGENCMRRFSRDVQRACAEKWGVKLADSKESE